MSGTHVRYSHDAMSGTCGRHSYHVQCSRTKHALCVSGTHIYITLCALSGTHVLGYSATRLRLASGCSQAPTTRRSASGCVCQLQTMNNEPLSVNPGP
eukprot:3940313-Rhodomonas_salina.1